ncbi:MAG: hypothetical protein MUF78_00110 [Candidatus Edwardsbacteria bacterium]|jgi:hypothetical protein|nr:hypothetical protein [Candidatus Edwardsbacteria bacterium]
MTFVDPIIKDHSCDQALQRTLGRFAARRRRRAVGIPTAVAAAGLSGGAMGTIGHG